jgi:crotonobetainyl-CoA:carnitine CoA-transferase CaiB-like acyl-CoA transferase
MTTAGFLGGLKVLELGEMVAAPYCAKLLGDLGADVVKVEGPNGDRARRVGPFVAGGRDPERSILFLHCNTSKRSVRIDVETEAGAARFAELAARADLLVIDRRVDQGPVVGLRTEALLAAQPALVVLELTPFGASGPYQDFKAHPFNTFHAAGEGYLTPVASYLMPEVVDRPPLRQGRFAAEYKLATYAATLALAAIRHAQATGVGQYIECSKQDLLLGLNFFEFQGWLSTGVMPTRASLAVPFGGIMPCKDGYLQFTFHEEHQWRALVKLMGDPEWAGEEWAAGPATRASRATEINARLEEWLSTRTRDDVVRDGQQIGCTVAPYQSVAEVASSAQFGERRFFQAVTHPIVGTHRYPTGAWRFSGVQPSPGPAPLLGEHDAELAHLFPRQAAGVPSSPPGDGRPRCGPLDGLRVVDFTWAVAGPTATMVLASFGAEVIKVETSLRLDVLRRSGYIGATTNRQKKAITLDLRHPKAVALVKRLVAVSDVVAESFRPGVMDGLGLGYDALRAVKHDIVMLSSSMAGQTGPLAHFAGYAPMFVALSGLGDMTGYPDGPPTQIRVGGDIIVGVHAAFALVAAILHQHVTGNGCHVDLSAIESQASLIGDSLLDFTVNGEVQRRSGNHEPDVAPHNCYRCDGDDQWISIVVETDDEWQALVKLMGDPNWARSEPFATGRSRSENRHELDRRIEAWTTTQPAVDVMTQLQSVGVAAVPSYRAPELFVDPHVMFRDMVTEVPSGDGSMPLLRLGGRFSATPMQLDRAGPAIGEHNDEVLRGLLGLTDHELDDLAAEGVFT